MADPIVRIVQMLRLGFDKGAASGESENAAVLASRLARKEGIYFEHIEAYIFSDPRNDKEPEKGPAKEPEKDSETDPEKLSPTAVREYWRNKNAEFDPETYCIKFGKYKGQDKTINWIVENDMSYANWLIKTMAAGSFMQAIFWEAMDVR